MQPHQLQVVDDQADLADKIDRLDQFIQGESFRKLPLDEQARLQWQLGVMEEYSTVLLERIDHFDRR
jgi:hypothetical protein